MCDALPPHYRPRRPLLPVAKRLWLGNAMPLHASLASASGDTECSAVISQNPMPSVLSSSTPLTTAGTSIVHLVQSFEAWLSLPNPSRWLIHTIRLSCAIKFTRRPPKFSSVLESLVAVQDASVLHEEIAVLLAKDAIEQVPPAEMKQSFYGPSSYPRK